MRRTNVYKEMGKSGRHPRNENRCADRSRNDWNRRGTYRRKLDYGGFGITAGRRIKPADQRGRTAGSQGVRI